MIENDGVSCRIVSASIMGFPPYYTLSNFTKNHFYLLSQKEIKLLLLFQSSVSGKRNIRCPKVGKILIEFYSV